MLWAVVVVSEAVAKVVVSEAVVSNAVKKVVVSEAVVSNAVKKVVVSEATAIVLPEASWEAGVRMDTSRTLPS